MKSIYLIIIALLITIPTTSFASQDYPDQKEARKVERKAFKKLLKEGFITYSDDEVDPDAEIWAFGAKKAKRALLFGLLSIPFYILFPVGPILGLIALSNGIKAFKEFKGKKEAFSREERASAGFGVTLGVISAAVVAILFIAIISLLAYL